MKKGLASYFGYELPYRDLLKLISEAGFHCISLFWGENPLGHGGTPRERLAEEARRAGLDVENMHADFSCANLLWCDQLDAEALIQRYLSNIDDCHAYRIPMAVLHLTSGDTPPPANELGIDRMRRLVEHAERKDVTIALENLRRPDYLDVVFGRITSDRLKFCYDCGHVNRFSKKWDLLERFGDKLAALHLHDNDATNDQHRIPGEGSIDWDLVTRQLKNTGYQGPITLEVTRLFSGKWNDAPPETFLAEAYNRACEIVHKVR